jgi:methylglutaconyl-CoA hydratase
VSEPTLLIENQDGIRTLTLNRPQAMNALSLELLAALHEALDRVLVDPDARCVIVTGTGERAFCAGADLKERTGMDEHDVRRCVAQIRGVMDKVANLPMPTIAAVNGAALGGGTELALACDLRVIAESARMGLTETSLAIIPGAGGTQRLPRIVGLARAKEMIFTARQLDAAECLAIGLANRSVGLDHLLVEARSLAADIVKNGPVALKAAKQAIDRGMEMNLADALVLESTCYETTINTEDRVEGLTAFREKRKPVYRGR